MCEEYLQQGFTGFKLKVGSNLEDDKRRCKLVRDVIGDSNNLVGLLTITNKMVYLCKASVYLYLLTVD